MNCSGLPVSRGIAIGRAFVYKPFNPVIKEKFITEKEKAEHNERLRAAIKTAGDELAGLAEKMNEVDGDKALIFEAHRDIVDDIAVIDEMLALINDQLYDGTYAIDTVYNTYIKMFQEMTDEVIRERYADFRDVKMRLLRKWMGVTQKSLAEIDEPSVVFAHDLLPSDTATLNRAKVLAIVTEIGGNTSHSAIIARSYRIPAVLGVKSVMDNIEQNDDVIVDAMDGKVIIKPTDEESAAYRIKLEHYNAEQAELIKFRGIEPVMKADGNGKGERIAVCVNIGSVSDEELEAQAYTDGVGLFRSEFLFMQGSELPSENEQFRVYKKAAETFGERQVILRTLDIGGDKTLECMSLPHEDNPFLGCRALRLCFTRPDIFQTQLRAALRASVYGNLALMFPMVGSLDDIVGAKGAVEEAKSALRKAGEKFNENIKLGIMIEIPSVAMIADKVVKVVDFASVGTNDLCQYLTAVDRLNPGVADYYQSYHPSMFRLMNFMGNIFEKEGKTLSICGEMGGDYRAIPAFIGMGFRKFSMSSSSVAAVKKTITATDMTTAREIAKKTTELNTAAEIEIYLNSCAEKILGGK